MVKNIFITLFLFLWLFQISFWNDDFLNWEKLENKIIKNTEKSPDFKINFQRPSYVDDINWEEIIYKCDEEKEECKVNFNFTKTNWKKLSSKLRCELKTNFESDQFNKCNPNTVVFWKWIYEIIIKVSEKKDFRNFSIRKIVIINWEINIENKYFEYFKKAEKIEKLKKKLFSWEIKIWKIISDEAKIKEKNNIEKNNNSETSLEFNYIFQNPSYILEKNIIKNKYFCDKSREECKINLKLVREDWKDISSNFLCEIKIKSESEEIILNKCNPTTKILSKKEEYEIVFKIYQKDLVKNFKEKNIIISNVDEVIENVEDEINDSESILEWQNIDDGEEIVKNSWTRYYLPQTKISVQWKMWKNKKLNYRKIVCLTYKKCSINFTSGKIYKSQREWISFYWNFWNGRKYYWYNPKSIKYLPWKYNVKLKVLDNYGNKKVEYFNVEILKKYKKSEQKKMSKNLKLVINYKQEAYDYLNKNYFWLKKNYFSKNFNKLVIKKGQKNYKKLIKNIWKLEINNIFWKVKKSKLTRKNKKLKVSLLTEGFYPQGAPRSPLKDNVDLKKKLEKQKLLKIKKLRKNIKLNISFQKKNLKISWKTFPQSKVVINIWEQKYYLFSDNIWKYTLKTNNLIAGNYKILVSAYSKKWELIAQKFSKEKIITKQYIYKMQSYVNKKRISKYKKKVKKIVFKIKKKTFKVTQAILENKPEFWKIVFNIKIFIFNILLVVMWIFMIFIMFIKRRIL